MRVLAVWLHLSPVSLSTMTSQMTNRQFVQSGPAPAVQCTRGAGDATLYKLSLKGIPPAPGSGGGPGPTHSPAHGDRVTHDVRRIKCFYARIIFCKSL